MMRRARYHDASTDVARDRAARARDPR